MKNGHEITTTVSHKISPDLVPVPGRRVRYGDGENLMATVRQSVVDTFRQTFGMDPLPEQVTKVIWTRLTAAPASTTPTGQRRRRFSPRDGRTVTNHGPVKIRAIVEKVTEGYVRFKTHDGSVGWSTHKNRHALVPGDKVTVKGTLKSSKTRGRGKYITGVEIIP